MTKSRPTTVLKVKGMDCPACAVRITEAVDRVPGVEDVTVDYVSGTLTISGNPAPAAVKAAVRNAGYDVESDELDRTPEPGEPAVPRKRAVTVAAAGLAVLAGGLGRWQGVTDWVCVPLLLAGWLAGGVPIFRKGAAAAARLRLDMNFLMSAASVGAWAIGEWTEGAVVIVLYAAAELLEAFSADRSRRAVSALVKLAPPQACLLTTMGEKMVDSSAVEVGASILVKPGAVIPLDGVVLSGSSEVNQSVLTGEPLPVLKEPGGEVFAGTVNGSGALVIRTTRPATDTALARIVRLLEQARLKKARLQRLVERFARVYTPAVVGLAVVVMVAPPLLGHGNWSTWVYRSLALLVISCPCALVLSTPVTVASGLAGAARNGVLIKGGVYLENLAKVKAVAFDKTGTLTAGKPEVVQVLPLNGLSAEEVVRRAVAVEAKSEHPIAGAVTECARRMGIAPVEVGTYQALPGRGGRALVNGRAAFVGNHKLFEDIGACDGTIHGLLQEIEDARQTAVLVGTDQGVDGVLVVADQLRSEASQVVAALRKSGIHCALLTGDNHRTARAVAEVSGIDEVHAELQPSEKAQKVAELQAKHGMVAVVGDGVNDAPALALADVGIAMGGIGSEATLETADVVLAGDHLDKLPKAIGLSQRVRGLIWTNIVVSVGIKAVFLGLAVTGNATMWMAVFSDMGVSLLVIANGMRGLRFD